MIVIPTSGLEGSVDDMNLLLNGNDRIALRCYKGIEKTIGGREGKLYLTVTDNFVKDVYSEGISVEKVNNDYYLRMASDCIERVFSEGFMELISERGSFKFVYRAQGMDL